VQERLRPYQESVPAAPWQDPAQCREHHPVVRLESRPSNLSAKNRQLVPEHENLQLLRPLTTPEEHDQLQQAANDDV
jgi:hypothetical protein